MKKNENETNRQYLTRALGVAAEFFDNEYINPLRLVLSEEFKRKEPTAGNKGLNFRQRAINRCIKARVGFHSEQNTCSNLGELVFKVKSPVSGTIKEVRATGGNNNCTHFVVDFGKDDVKIDITIPHDNISVSFND